MIKTCEAQVKYANPLSFGGNSSGWQDCGKEACCEVKDNDSNDVMPLCSDHKEKFVMHNGTDFEIKDYENE